jgi:hypothetical protein
VDRHYWEGIRDVLSDVWLIYYDLQK